MRKVILLLLIILPGYVLSARENKDVWWITGLNGGVYSYIREDIPETEIDETLPGGNISLGLKTQRFAFKPDKLVGSWGSMDFRIPFLSIVEGEVKQVEALEGSIQVMGNINIGVGLRSPGNKALSFYGGLGLHTYLSYLHAYTLLSTPLLDDPVKTEIEQFDTAFGLGAEIGMKLNTKGRLFFVAGSGLAWDFLSWQDSRVHVEFDPPVNQKTRGLVKDYMALEITPHISLGLEY
ncbi:MAG: hypothetical protein PQJ58_01745 [Spirochaetales bacterium]|nr:hypothetical protein [Spirochaetales bacterium]